MTRAALAAAVIVSLAHLARASAGACPAPHLTVLPSGAAPVPTNVELRVLFDAGSVEAIELVDEQTRQIAASGLVDAADATIAIRDAAGAEIAATTQRTPSTAQPGFVVKPSAPLAANAAYAVVVRGGGKAYVVARFTTGAGPDDDAPALDKLGKPRFYRWKGSRPPHWKDPHGTFAELTAGTSTGAIGFELHGADPATLDTLRAVVRGGGPAIRFGSLDSCRGPDFAFPQAKAPLRLWVRAFDAAGNLSPLRAITIDTRHPRAR